MMTNEEGIDFRLFPHGFVLGLIERTPLAFSVTIQYALGISEPRRAARLPRARPVPLSSSSEQRWRLSVFFKRNAFFEVFQ